MRAALSLLVLCTALPLAAQSSPMPGPDDPRIQSLDQEYGERARLVVFPQGSLTLILSTGEQVERIVLSDQTAFRVTVTGHNDSVFITPARPDALATMSVETATGRLDYDLETGSGLAAAFVVRLVDTRETFAEDFRQDLQPDLATMSGRYSVKGDRSLRPQQIADDGYKTYIEWGPEQSLPAVLGIGPTGEEEIVAGYMRDGLFTIDRVYGELVFRIDKDKTTAQRQTGSSAR
jgi:type IV secretion system protein VirB9